MTVRGDLNDISLPLLIQLTCGRGQTAQITIHHQRLEHGTISFKEGTIVHAENGETEGEEAIYKMLSWKHGQFKLAHGAELPHQQTVFSSWKQLLSEGKRHVQSKQFANGVPPSQALEKLPPIHNLNRVDQDQENSFIHLLSVLEHLRSELADEETLQRPLNVLGLLLTMVNRTIDWYGKLRPDPTERSILPRIMGQVLEINPAVRLFGMEQGRLQAAVMQTLYKNWPGSLLSRQRLMQDLFNCLLDILEAYLNELLRGLTSETLAKQWRITFRTFLADMDEILKRVRWQK